MAPATIDVASVMAALGRLEGQGAETLRRLDKIEGALVPKAEVAAVEARVKWLEKQLVWGVRGVLTAVIGGVGAALGAALHWRG